MAELRLEGVAKRFAAVTAVDALSLDVASGEFIVLLGPSGAGKTTTLRLVAGLEQADRGSVHIGGRDVTHAAPALRAQVLGSEYLGTSRIVTLATADGVQLRAKLDVANTAARGDHVGLEFDAAAVSLFDRASGRALRTARDDAVRAAGARHG